MNGEPFSADPSVELGRYRVLEVIGRGAWGTVYRALDTLIGREVAIKSFRATASASGAGESTREQLLREARSAGMLSHPNVVTLYDVVEGEDGSFFISMEYVEGRSLAEILEDGGPPDFERTVDWISQVASALDYLHAMGLVHRDIKPANVLITAGGRVKLTDFGIAAPGPGRDSEGAPAEGEEILGTPGYMAPEQILGREVSARADVWSLGVVLYELLAGRRPFEGRTVAEVVHRVVHEPAPPPGEERGLPAGVRPLLDRAMAKDPRWRFGSAGELAGELRQILYRAAAAAGGEDSEEDMLERTLMTGPPQDAAEGVEDPGRRPRRYAAGTEGPNGSRASRGTHRRLSGRAGAAAAALVALALSALVYVAYRSFAADPVTPIEVDMAKADFDGPSMEALRLLREGQRLLGAGDAEGAALFFEVVERLEPRLPDPERIARMRRQAEAEARRRGGELEAARSALADREARELVATARGRVVAGERDASEARAALDRAAETLGPGGGATLNPSAPGAEPRVRLVLTSDSPEGVITLYADGRQLLRRGFSYYERSWWFARTPSTGSFEQEVVVPPEAESLWVYVALPDGPAQRLEVRGRVPENSGRVLRIHLPAVGEATATWD